MAERVMPVFGAEPAADGDVVNFFLDHPSVREATFDPVWRAWTLTMQDDAVVQFRPGSKVELAAAELLDAAATGRLAAESAFVLVFIGEVVDAEKQVDAA